MSETASYEFLDCGGGRRLERFGSVVVDRPAPAATQPPALEASAWKDAALRFSPTSGWSGESPAEWRVRLGPVTLALRPGAHGQIGVFPEHAAVCQSLERALSERAGGGRDGFRALNVFAYTGLATLWLASLPCVAETVHLDAAKASVNWARENAEASGLANARVRWLVDDALAFMRRETRRDRKYDVVLLDPPSYGVGTNGKRWKLEERLDELLDAAAALLSPNAAALCVSCHSEGWTGERLRQRTAGLSPALSQCCGIKLRLSSKSVGHGLECSAAVLMTSAL